MRGQTSTRNRVHNIIYYKVKGVAIDHGKQYEHTARCNDSVSFIEAINAKKVGIIQTSVQIQDRPYKFNNLLILPLQLKNFTVKKHLTLKRTSDYYFQVQGQLNICQKSKCYFVVYCKDWFTVEEISRDDSIWTDAMVPKLYAMVPTLNDKHQQSTLMKFLCVQTMKIWKKKLFESIVYLTCLEGSFLAYTMKL